MKIEPESEVGKKRTLRTSSRIMITVNGVKRDIWMWHHGLGVSVSEIEVQMPAA
jgi:hypothetical protein